MVLSCRDWFILPCQAILCSCHTILVSFWSTNTRTGICEFCSCLQSLFSQLLHRFPSHCHKWDTFSKPPYLLFNFESANSFHMWPCLSWASHSVLTVVTNVLGNTIMISSLSLRAWTTREFGLCHWRLCYRELCCRNESKAHFASQTYSYSS